MADRKWPDDLVGLMLAAAAEHVFASTTTCVCGYGPPMSSDWERHRMEAALIALFDAGCVLFPLHDGQDQDEWRTRGRVARGGDYAPRGQRVDP